MTRQEAAMMIENDIRIHHDDLSGNYRKALRMAISALEQPHWIPCSEGMPKINKVVLVTCKTKNDRRFMDRAKWTGDRWTRATDEMYKVRSAKVEFLAWMPLPGLYKE